LWPEREEKRKGEGESLSYLKQIKEQPRKYMLVTVEFGVMSVPIKLNLKQSSFFNFEITRPID
jgi:hypothetical protein